MKPSHSRLLALAIIPIVIFLYFLRWRTKTIYGDDLFIYKFHSELTDYYKQVNVPLFASQKYRPVTGFIIHSLISLFGKNLWLYFLFNVAIQSLCAMTLYLIIERLTRYRFLSCLFTLLYALSRFTYYNISQLYNGGALEGLAVLFFLCALYCLLSFNYHAQQSRKNADMALALLFANLCIYTHERYIVLFPVLIVTILASNSAAFKMRQKVIFASFAIGSVALNYFIKSFLLNVSFMTGTSGASIEFEPRSALSFLTDGVLSILFINSGPDFTAGIQFSALDITSKGLCILIAIVISISIFISLITEMKRKSFDDPEFTKRYQVLLLSALGVALLVPAVITIRLEQRWLQASYIIAIILVAISFSRIQTVRTRNYLTAVFISACLFMDNRYISRGINNYFMKDAERTAFLCKEALLNNVIHSSTTNLFFVERRRDPNYENGAIWAIRAGYIFEYYGNKTKRIYYADSVYKRLQAGDDTLFSHFDPATDQVVTITDSVRDLTAIFARDSLKNF